MFSKILIANRGEIAVRVIRACRELGISTVAVYSDVDKDALFVALADEAICIGPATPAKSYLNIQAIIESACLTGAEAIHPGFGFLSENSRFAKICEETNIKFIGPNYETINLLGNKSNAKEMMKKAGVPVIPGSDGVIGSLEDAKKLAKKIGYPVMLKASSGGGGKGIRLCHNKDELEKQYDTVKQEALKAFGDADIYMEKFIENPRHIEVQILADEYGNAVYLGERECSIQRKNQKVLEESPSSFVDEKMRSKMGKAAVSAAKVAGYQNAGTIEFLVDKNKNFYFMEMNTRIQVEHPVTESVTGIDIVKAQIKIASGEKLEFKQEDIKLTGHSIECRINAENPSKGFMPSPGTIKELYQPGGYGVRIDSGIYAGYKIPPTYDSMLAKLIVHGNTRDEAIAIMNRALSEFVLEGVDNNIEFLFSIINNEDFKKGNFDTSFIEKNFKF